MLGYKIGGALGAVAYLLFFTAGVAIDSAPFRAQLLNGSVNWQAYLAVVCTYTPINVAILSLLAGLMGGCSSLITHKRRLEVEVDTPAGRFHRLDPRSLIYRTESPIASMLRSIVVYFGFTAGILVTTVDPFTAASPEKYIRLAAAVSFFSFVVGYDPTKFSGLLNTPIAGKSGAGQGKK